MSSHQHKKGSKVPVHTHTTGKHHYNHKHATTRQRRRRHSRYTKLERNIQQWIRAVEQHYDDAWDSVDSFECDSFTYKLDYYGYDSNVVPGVAWQHKAFVLAAVRIDGKSLQYAEDYLKNDLWVCQTAVENDPKAIQYVGTRLCRKRSLWCRAVERDGLVLEYADDFIRNDLHICITAVKQAPHALEYATAVHNNRDVVRCAVGGHGLVPTDEEEIDRILCIGDSRAKDRAMGRHGMVLKYAHKRLRDDLEICRIACENYPWAFEFVGPCVRDNRDFVWHLLTHTIPAFNARDSDANFFPGKVYTAVYNNMSLHLKKDKEIALHVITEGDFFTSLECVIEIHPAHLQDPDIRDSIIRRAVREDGFSYLFRRAPVLWSYRDIVQAAVASDFLLYFNIPLTSNLSADEDIVLAALRRSRSDVVLRHAPDNIRDNRVCVTEAVRYNGLALEAASDFLRGDREIVGQAVRQNGLALEAASDFLRGDPEIVGQAVRQNGLALRYVNNHVILRDGIDLLATAIQNLPASKNWRRAKRILQLLEKTGQFSTCKAILQALLTFQRGFSYTSMPSVPADDFLLWNGPQAVTVFVETIWKHSIFHTAWLVQQWLNKEGFYGGQEIVRHILEYTELPQRLQMAKQVIEWAPLFAAISQSLGDDEEGDGRVFGNKETGDIMEQTCETSIVNRSNWIERLMKHEEFIRLMEHEEYQRLVEERWMKQLASRAHSSPHSPDYPTSPAYSPTSPTYSPIDSDHD